MEKVLLINELGEIIGEEYEDIAHSISNPKMHASIMVLYISNDRNIIGVRKNSFNETFPEKFDFYIHHHVKKSIGEEIEEIKRRLNISKVEIREFIYISRYGDEITEKEYSYVLLTSDNFPPNCIEVDITNIHEKNSTPRLYAFVKYHIIPYKDNA